MANLDLQNYKDEPVMVAVSGGSDSLGLLFWLREQGFSNLTAVTIDHGLRAAAADEAVHVGKICDAHSISHIIAKITVESQGNLQANARAGRYVALANMAREHGAACVMIGHSADDVAETFLMNAFRGSGVAGLSTMRACFERHDMRFMRPVLHLRRGALRELLIAKGIEWIDDPSNEDAQFDRVRMRKLLDDAEAAGFDPMRLKLSADNVAGEARALRFALQKFYDTHLAWVLEGVQMAIDEAELLALPDAQINRLIGDITRYFGGGGYVPRKSSVTALRAQLWLDGQGRATLGGCLFERRRGQLFACAELSALPEAQKGAWHLWEADDVSIAPLGEGARRPDELRNAGVSALAYATAPAIFMNNSWKTAEIGKDVRLVRAFPYVE